MSIVLLRVDERLIHGQVVIGWGNQLRPERYVIADDELADSEWEQDLFRLGAGSAEVVFVTPDVARDRLSEWDQDPLRTILLTRDIPAMARLGAHAALSGRSINLGGIHHGPGRDEVLTYLHLSDQDRNDLRALADSGAAISARDLPDAHKVSLATLLGS